MLLYNPTCQYVRPVGHSHQEIKPVAAIIIITSILSITMAKVIMALVPRMMVKIPWMSFIAQGHDMHNPVYQQSFPRLQHHVRTTRNRRYRSPMQ